VDLTIPSELRLLQESAREYVRRELLPLEAQVEEEDDIAPDTMRRLRKRAVEHGFYGFNLPAELGGGGVGPLGQVLVGEELGRTTMALGEAFGRLSQSLAFCTEDQADWLLKPALQADITVCNALTEPGAGSDLGGIVTKARREGDHWRLDGSKQFISNAESCDYLLVLAVTDPTASLTRRFTTFIVGRNDPGVHMMPRFKKMGWRGYPISSFSLDGCLVDDNHVLGEVNGGFVTTMASVNTTRLFLASKCVGAAQELIRLSREYASQRKTFGRLLADHQAIQFKLADMDVELEAARWLVMAGAWKGENNQPDFRIAASRAKLYASEMVGRAADAAIVVFGGSGYMSDLPIERMYRDSRAFRIGEGTSEMQRIQIARHVLSGA
jgi:acyl-CoA dehydrogenase